MICSLLFTDASHKYFASSSLQAEKREHGTDPRATNLTHGNIDGTESLESEAWNRGKSCLK